MDQLIKMKMWNWSQKIFQPGFLIQLSDSLELCAIRLAQRPLVDINMKPCSETDIREFHEQCLEIGIDLDRLERVPAPEIIPDGDRLTLNDFVKSYDKAQEE